MDDNSKYESKLLDSHCEVDCPDDRVIWEWAVRGLHGCLAIIESLILSQAKIDNARFLRLVKAVERIHLIMEALGDSSRWTHSN
jgi:hypothetical protein